MDIEELKKALKSEDGKELLNSLIDEAKKPLIAKRDELMNELKSAREKNSEFEKRLETLEEEKVNKSGDVEKIKEQLTAKHQKEIEKLLAEKTDLSGKLQKHVVDGGLVEALAKAKVSPALMDAAKALIISKYKGEVGDNDGKPFAKFDGKSVEEFVTGWAQSDAGKAFVLANANSGGGSSGTNGNASGGTGQKTISRNEFDQANQAQRMAYAKEGVKVVD